ncbi:MAG: helix-turn-helix domain-containing protein [Draconibacterium sp.]|nr:helix-turn-helix domain-containing protein [Draconibacterium sp.]
MNLLSDTFPLRILNIASSELDQKWNYKDICSPFFRMYYIFEGEGSITHKGIKYILTPGKLFLIPSFTNSSYYCNESLSMVYVIFTNQLYNEMRIYNFHDRVFEVEAQPQDKGLIERLLFLNPKMELLDNDPQKYDNWHYLDKNRNSEPKKPFQEILESQGILLQLFSRFSISENDDLNIKNSAISKIFPAIQYINNNLEESLSVKKLAQEICLSPDYFSRLFLEVTKSRPIEFIQRKRIEKAQLLLVTTKHSLDKIAELSGLNNASYLSRLFKRYTGKSPGKYRLAGFV